MHDSIIEMLHYYRRQANSCCGKDAYKKIDEIISVLAEEVPSVKYKRYIIKEPYDSAKDEEYTNQLRYLGKIIALRIIALGDTDEK